MFSDVRRPNIGDLSRSTCCKNSLQIRWEWGRTLCRCHQRIQLPQSPGCTPKHQV